MTRRVGIPRLIYGHFLALELVLMVDIRRQIVRICPIRAIGILNRRVTLARLVLLLAGGGLRGANAASTLTTVEHALVVHELVAALLLV